VSDEKQAAKSPKRPSESDIKRALGASAEHAKVDGARVTIVYPSLDVYSERTSADVEALRKLGEIVESSVSPHDPDKERLASMANAPVVSAYQPKPDGAQRLVVVFA
jgi:hypothetical protein